QVSGDELSAAAKIDQPHFRPIANDDLAIRSLERGTRDDARLLLCALTVNPGGDALEPRLAVRIGQRNARMHLGDIGLRVEQVAFLESPAEARRQFLSDRGLARTRDAHDHEDRRTAAMGTRAVEAVHTSRISDEDRIRAADEEPAFDHSDDSSDPPPPPVRITAAAA